MSRLLSAEAIRNRIGEIVGLTCRVGRAIFGTVDIIRDMVESGKSILLSRWRPDVASQQSEGGQDGLTDGKGPRNACKYLI